VEAHENRSHKRATRTLLKMRGLDGTGGAGISVVQVKLT
jgi:hypothetical protein